jgi:hypothetical protein
MRLRAGNVEAIGHGTIGQELVDKEDALPADAGEEDFGIHKPP